MLKAAHNTIIFKSCFRWADALYQRAEGDEDMMGAEDIKMIMKMSKRASQLSGGKNAQIQEFLEKVKDLKVAPEPEEVVEEKKASEPEKKDKKLRGAKIEDSDSEP